MGKGRLSLSKNQMGAKVKIGRTKDGARYTSSTSTYKGGYATTTKIKKNGKDIILKSIKTTC
jgi:hypothetical protein